ncbi:diguanylate cyclase [Marimonas sp. MJW-29]|uniref:diguanylate cyclase n=1 Tax=Sulfitobacter sediminis TaxID=3234186 RepID=A0ABV3RIY7_9RHOB
MQGKILIVDAIATNRIVLKVKLQTAFYDVLQATTMADAIALVRSDAPDLILAALSLPDGGAAELCTALAKVPTTEHIPLIATACQPEAGLRLRTLEAGVQDVLCQPVEETLLLARVRSLIRAHGAAAEWQMREDTCRALGLAEPASDFEEQGHCVLVGSDTPQLQSFAMKIRPVLRTKLTLASAGGLMRQGADEKVPDVFVLVLPPAVDVAMEELRLIAALRAGARTRHVGVIALQTAKEAAVGATALDLGADDLMTDGFDAAELALRIKAVMRRKRMSEQLRATVRTGLQAAVFDPLTGLYNRRYAMPHLDRVAAHAAGTGRPFAVMVADLDHFKRINDRYGHASGDAVLIEVAHRLRRALRATDMVARIGGEEFMVILPGTTRPEAQGIAVRICEDIAAAPFVIPGSATAIPVTISIGMAVGNSEEGALAEPDAATTGQALLAQADRALYAAKGGGRNQVTLGRPAA